MNSFTKPLFVTMLQTVVIFLSMMFASFISIILNGSYLSQFLNIFAFLFIALWAAIVSIPFVLFGSIIISSLKNLEDRRFSITSALIGGGLGVLNILLNSIYRGSEEFGGLNFQTFEFLALPFLISLVSWVILTKKFLRIKNRPIADRTILLL
jgi:hypothetical protein